MKVAVVSDIHGNLPALETCFSAIARIGVDKVYFLGDAVGYLPDERSVIERLLAETAGCQKGNHEELLLAPTPRSIELEDSYALGAARLRLQTTPHWEVIRHWPEYREVCFGTKRMLFVHGSPLEPLFGYVYPDTDLTPFADVAYDYVVMANTHRPSLREYLGKRFVNIGSVGLPRDQGNLAAFGIYEVETDTFRIVRVPLDLDRIFSLYGGRAAPSVLKCFQRRSHQFVGEVLV